MKLSKARVKFETVNRRLNLKQSKKVRSEKLSFSMFLFSFLVLFFLFFSLIFEFPLLGFRWREFWFRTGGGARGRCFRGTPLLNYLVTIFILGSSVLTNMIHTKSTPT